MYMFSVGPPSWSWIQVWNSASAIGAEVDMTGIPNAAAGACTLLPFCTQGTASFSSGSAAGGIAVIVLSVIACSSTPRLDFSKPGVGDPVDAERVSDRRRRVAAGHDLEALFGDRLHRRESAIAGGQIAREARLVAGIRVVQPHRRHRAHRREADRAQRLRAGARHHRGRAVLARVEADADARLHAALEALAIAALAALVLLFGTLPQIRRGDVADLELDVGDGDAVVRAGLARERTDIDHQRGLGDRSGPPVGGDGQRLVDHPRHRAVRRKL